MGFRRRGLNFDGLQTGQTGPDAFDFTAPLAVLPHGIPDGGGHIGQGRLGFAHP